MNAVLQNLIEALREELKEYGEMLALLDQQQELVTHRRASELIQSVTTVDGQLETIHAARRERDQRLREAAREFGGERHNLGGLLLRLPENCRPLVQALIQENNELLIRVRQRARQNQILLGHAVDLMQRFVNSLVPGASAVTYNQSGRLPGSGLPQHAIYEEVG